MLKSPSLWSLCPARLLTLPGQAQRLEKEKEKELKLVATVGEHGKISHFFQLLKEKNKMGLVMERDRP